MKLLLDTNVLIDSILSREPFCATADLLLGLGEIGEFDLFISASQFTDALYILSSGGKHAQLEQARNAMKQARNSVHIAALGEADIDAVLASDWEDLEDACVYQAAREVRADAIITRNQKDFEKSSIPVFDCNEFFEWMKQTYGVEYENIAI